MARKFTVMGFTEAELGFVLAAFFAAVSVAYEHEREDAIGKTLSAEAALAAASTELEAARAHRDSLRRRHQILLDSIARKSNLTPPCTEKGEPDVPIAQITVLAADSYLIGGVETTFANVRRRLSAQIQRQRELGCMYYVHVLAVRGVDAPIFSAATRRVRGVFHVRERIQ